MNQLTRHSYRIQFLDDPVICQVDVLPVDQLRAEVEGNRQGFVDSSRQAVMLTLLWLHAASRRLDLVAKALPFDTFVSQLAAWDRVKPPEGEEEPVVDPTQPEESLTSSLHSPPVSPASTGSAPSSTIPPLSPPQSGSSRPTPIEEWGTDT